MVRVATTNSDHRVVPDNVAGAMNSRSFPPASLTADTADIGVSRSALAMRSGMAQATACSPAATAVPFRPRAGADAASAGQLSGAEAVARASLAATVQPASHPDPDTEVADLVADIRTLPPEQRSALRSVIAGMRRRSHDIFASPTALAVLLAAVGLVVGTDVGRAAAHSVAEVTSEITREVTVRTADAVAPLVRHLRKEPAAQDKVVSAGPVDHRSTGWAGTRPRTTARVTPFTGATMALPGMVGPRFPVSAPAAESGAVAPGAGSAARHRTIPPRTARGAGEKSVKVRTARSAPGPAVKSSAKKSPRSAAHKPTKRAQPRHR
jgi:hypothetical protein